MARDGRVQGGEALTHTTKKEHIYRTEISNSHVVCLHEKEKKDEKNWWTSFPHMRGDFICREGWNFHLFSLMRAQCPVFLYVFSFSSLPHICVSFPKISNFSLFHFPPSLFLSHSLSRATLSAQENAHISLMCGEKPLKLWVLISFSFSFHRCWLYHVYSWDTCGGLM